MTLSVVSEVGRLQHRRRSDTLQRCAASSPATRRRQKAHAESRARAGTTSPSRDSGRCAIPRPAGGADECPRPLVDRRQEECFRTRRRSHPPAGRSAQAPAESVYGALISTSLICPAGLSGCGSKACTRYPILRAAIPNMRPSWPPPRIPTVEPGPMEIPSDAEPALAKFVHFFLHVGSLDLLACARRDHCDPPPPPRAYALCLARCIGAFLWAILPRYRKLARENLSAAFANENVLLGDPPADISSFRFARRQRHLRLQDCCACQKKPSCASLRS